ncbi:MAG: hypothetical protein L3K07_03900 [Thermoplasmata archaeon]|nr:hypothetical protein [Thermoplasmata archaeon]
MPPWETVLIFLALGVCVVVLASIIVALLFPGSEMLGVWGDLDSLGEDELGDPTPLEVERP